jgi:hypothetical protein
MFGHLLLEAGLDDLLGDRLEQPVRAGQIITPPRAALTSGRTAARSPLRVVSAFFAAFRGGLTPTSVSVTIRPFPLSISVLRQLHR